MGLKAICLLLLCSLVVVGCGPAEDQGPGRLAVAGDIAELVPKDADAFFFVPSFAALEKAVLAPLKNTPLHLKATTGLAIVLGQMGPLTSYVDKKGPFAVAMTVRDASSDPEMTFIVRVRNIKEARAEAPQARWSGRYVAYSPHGKPTAGGGIHPLTVGLSPGTVVGAVNLKRLAAVVEPALDELPKNGKSGEFVGAARRILGSLEVLKVAFNLHGTGIKMRFMTTLREGTVLERRSRTAEPRDLEGLSRVLPPNALFSLVCSSPFDGFLAEILPGMEGTTIVDDDGPLGLAIVTRPNKRMAGVLVSPESSRSSRGFADKLLMGHSMESRKSRSVDDLRFDESIWKVSEESPSWWSPLIGAVTQRFCLIENHAVVTMGGEPKFLIDVADRFAPDAVVQQSALGDLLKRAGRHPIFAARGRSQKVASLFANEPSKSAASDSSEFEMFMGIEPGEFVLGLAFDIGGLVSFLEDL